VQNLTKVGVGDPNVVDVTPTGKGELLLTARGRGHTTLTIWTTKGFETRQVYVDDGRTGELGRLIKTMVNPSLRVEEFSGQTVSTECSTRRPSSSASRRWWAETRT